jgi:hypothetical protein
LIGGYMKTLTQKYKFKWNHIDIKSEKYLTIYEGIELEKEQNPPKFKNENLFIEIPKKKKITHVRLYLKYKDKICQIYEPGKNRIQLLIQRLKNLNLHQFEVFQKVIELLPKVSMETKRIGSNFSFNPKFSLEDFLKNIEFEKIKQMLKDHSNQILEYSPPPPPTTTTTTTPPPERVIYCSKNGQKNHWKSIEFWN